MLPLCLNAGMNISVQCDVDAGMPQQLAQALDISSRIDTIGGESMSQYMEVVLRDAGLREKLMKTVLIRSRFRRSVS